MTHLSLNFLPMPQKNILSNQKKPNEPHNPMMYRFNATYNVLSKWIPSWISHIV